MYKLLKTFDENCFNNGVYTVPEEITDVDMNFLLGRENDVKKIIFPKTLKYIDESVNLTNIDEFEFNSDFHFGPDVFRMTEDIKRIVINGKVIEANEDEKIGFYRNGFAKVNNDGVPTVYDKNGNDIEIEEVDNDLYYINQSFLMQNIFIPKTVKAMDFIDLSDRVVCLGIVFEDLSNGIDISSRILLQDGIYTVADKGKEIFFTEAYDVNYLFSINGELAFYDTDRESGERNICIYDANSEDIKRMTDTLELKNDRTTKLIDISGIRKLISYTPDLIGFLTDDKLEELEIKETVTEKQKRYVKLLDETEAEVEVEVLNYDFSSGWENLRKLKLGNRELLIPEGEKLTSMSDIAFLTEEGDISEDIIVNTKDEQGIYTYAYNGETKEFEKHDAKEFILGELEITETELDNLIEMLRYVKSDNRSVFLEHNFRVLSFERLKKYIEVVEPGLCEETIDRYKTEDTDVISLLDIEDINIDELKKINEMDKQKEEALKSLCLTEKDYRCLVLEMKRCKIMGKSVQIECEDEENKEQAIKLREYIEYEYPELIVTEEEQLGTESITFDTPITDELLKQKVADSQEEIKENMELIEARTRSTVGDEHHIRTYGNALKDYEEELMNTSVFKHKRREELESDIKFLKSELQYYENRKQNKLDRNARIASAKQNKDKFDLQAQGLEELMEEIENAGDFQKYFEQDQFEILDSPEIIGEEQQSDISIEEPDDDLTY